MKSIKYLLTLIIFASSQLFAITVNTISTPILNTIQANTLAELPIHCVETQYPYKLGQTIGSADDLKTPKQLHPAFYGCFDWHSAVHGHWSMVSLLKNHPYMDNADKLRLLLKKNITKENIAREVVYFHGQYNKSWERNYGWAWLLKLANELHTWDDPLARKLERNLKPLTLLIAQRFAEFLPKLHYPIRVGEHPNTAFGMTFAYDYALAVNDTSLQEVIKKRAMDFYSNDKNCPINWEPGGFDFLSPCLQEMSIMQRIMPEKKFLKWLNKFLPELRKKSFKLAVGIVSDRTDGKLVHLDGINFSRAWCLYDLANKFKKYKHLIPLANRHINQSMPYVVGDSYEGGHWLGSFVIYALNQGQKR